MTNNYDTCNFIRDAVDELWRQNSYRCSGLTHFWFFGQTICRNYSISLFFFFFIFHLSVSKSKINDKTYFCQLYNHYITKLLLLLCLMVGITEVYELAMERYFLQPFLVLSSIVQIVIELNVQQSYRYGFLLPIDVQIKL